MRFLLSTWDLMLEMSYRGLCKHHDEKWRIKNKKTWKFSHPASRPVTVNHSDTQNSSFSHGIDVASKLRPLRTYNRLSRESVELNLHLFIDFGKANVWCRKKNTFYSTSPVYLHTSFLKPGLRFVSSTNWADISNLPALSLQLATIVMFWKRKRPIFNSLASGEGKGLSRTLNYSWHELSSNFTQIMWQQHSALLPKIQLNGVADTGKSPAQIGSGKVKQSTGDAISRQEI